MFGERNSNIQHVQNFQIMEQDCNLGNVHMRSEFQKNMEIYNNAFNGRQTAPMTPSQQFQIKREMEDSWSNRNYATNGNATNTDMNNSLQINQPSVPKMPLDIYNNTFFYQNNFQTMFPLELYERHQAIANSFLSAYSNASGSNLMVQQYLQQCNPHQVINNFNPLKESNYCNESYFNAKTKNDNCPLNENQPTYNNQMPAKTHTPDILPQVEDRNISSDDLERVLKPYIISCDDPKLASPNQDQVSYNNNELNNMFLNKGVQCDGFKIDSHYKSEQNGSDKIKEEISTTCWKCNFSFTNSADFKEHYKICVSSSEEVERDDKMLTENISKAEDTPKGRYSCDTCTYVCQSPAILKIHERVHSGEKPFACSFCDYKSGQKNNVAKHVLVHMKKKPYRCQYCDYRCAQKNNLVVHERTHTGVKPFACTFCEYKTVQKPNLVKHMYLHTNEKPFACDICDYRCVQKTNLTKHKQKHTLEKPYECTDCDYKSSQKANLNKHQLIHKKYEFKCSKCSFNTFSKLELDKHGELKHKEEDNAMEDVDLMYAVKQEGCYSTNVKTESSSANF